MSFGRRGDTGALGGEDVSGTRKRRLDPGIKFKDSSNSRMASTTAKISSLGHDGE